MKSKIKKFDLLTVISLMIFFSILLLSFQRSTADVQTYTGNPRYLTDRNGNPEFLAGAYWFVPKEDSDYTYSLSYADQHGYNVIRLLAIADGWILNGTYDPNFHYPFMRTGGGNITADNGPKFNLSQFDNVFWTNFNNYLTAAENQGLVVIVELFGVSGPFGRSGTDTNFANNFWHISNSVGGATWPNHDTARRYFFDDNPSNPQGQTYLLHQLQLDILNKFLDYTIQHNNIVYQPVNEAFLSYSGMVNAVDFQRWVRSVILARDSDAVILLNTRLSTDPSHPDPYGISFPDFDGVTIHAPYRENAGQSNAYDIARMITEARDILYPQNRFFGFDVDVGRPYRENYGYDPADYHRKAAWTALTIGSGTFIVLKPIFEENPIPPAGTPPPDRDFEYLLNFIEDGQLQPWDMSPAQGLLRTGIATLIARADEEIIAYLRSGGQISLDLSDFPTNLIYEWYDPRDGSFPLQGELTGGGSNTPIPTGTLDTTKDWVLRIYEDTSPPEPQPQGIIFFDDFEDGNASNWNPPSGQQSWSVVLDGSYVFKHTAAYNDGTEWRTTNGQTVWRDYTLKAKVKYFNQYGEIGVLFYHNGSGNFYEFKHRKVDNRVFLKRYNPSSYTLINAAPGPTLGINEWWNFKVEVKTNPSTTDIAIKLWKEGQPEEQASVFTCLDGTGRLQAGKIGLYSRSGDHRYDDVTVTRPSGGSSCFLEGTPITLSDGKTTTPIEQIKAGDKVLSFNEKESVIGTVVKTFEHLAVHGYFAIKTNDGRIINVTGEHPVFSDNTYRPVYELKAGDSLYILKDNSLQEILIESITKVEKKIPVYNLEVDLGHNYFAEGCLVHNKIEIPLEIEF